MKSFFAEIRLIKEELVCKINLKFGQWAAFVYRRPYWVLGGSLIVCCCCAIGLIPPFPKWVDGAENLYSLPESMARDHGAMHRNLFSEVYRRPNLIILTAAKPYDDNSDAEYDAAEEDVNIFTWEYLDVVKRIDSLIRGQAVDPIEGRRVAVQRPQGYSSDEDATNVDEESGLDGYNHTAVVERDRGDASMDVLTFQDICAKEYNGSCSVASVIEMGVYALGEEWGVGEPGDPPELYVFDGKVISPDVRGFIPDYLMGGVESEPCERDLPRELAINFVPEEKLKPSSKGQLYAVTPTTCITKAQALLMMYDLRDEPDMEEINMDWEKALVGILNDNRIYDGVRISVNAYRSRDDELRASTSESSDILFVILTFVILVSYACVLNFSCDLYRSKSIPALAGAGAALMGLVSGLGFICLLGFAFVPTALICPFLVMGIGVDDMFVIVNSYALAYTIEGARDRVVIAMTDSGLSITITTLTNLIAFTVGAFSPYLSIRNFCLFSAAGLFMGYVYVLTFFLAVLCLDAKREEVARVCIFCLPKHTPTDLMRLQADEARKEYLEDGEMSKPHHKVCNTVSDGLKGYELSTFSLVSLKARHATGCDEQKPNSAKLNQRHVQRRKEGHPPSSCCLSAFVFWRRKGPAAGVSGSCEMSAEQGMVAAPNHHCTHSLQTHRPQTGESSQRADYNSYSNMNPGNSYRSQYYSNTHQQKCIDDSFRDTQVDEDGGDAAHNSNYSMMVMNEPMHYASPASSSNSKRTVTAAHHSSSRQVPAHGLTGEVGTRSAAHHDGGRQQNSSSNDCIGHDSAGGVDHYDISRRERNSASYGGTHLRSVISTCTDEQQQPGYNHNHHYSNSRGLNSVVYGNYEDQQRDTTKHHSAGHSHQYDSAAVGTPGRTVPPFHTGYRKDSKSYEDMRSRGCGDSPTDCSHMSVNHHQHEHNSSSSHHHDNVQQYDQFSTRSSSKGDPYLATDLTSEYSDINEEYLCKQLAAAKDLILQEPLGNVGRRWRSFFLNYYGPFLIRPWVKMMMIGLFSMFLGISIYGLIHLGQGLELKELSPDNSHLQDFDKDMEDHFVTYDVPVDLFFTDAEVEWWTPETIAALYVLDDTLKSRPSTKLVNNPLLAMIEDPELTGRLTSGVKQVFLSTLFNELSSTNGKYSQFVGDFVWQGETLVGWKFNLLPAFMTTSEERAAWMTDIRSICEEMHSFDPPLVIYAFNYMMVFYESDLGIMKSVMVNMLVAAVAMLLVAFILIPQLLAGLLVIVTMTLIDMGLFGFMYFWGVKLNMVSMINLVISIGFAVDYSAHMCHTFTHCEGETRDLRTIETLVLMGNPVFQGAISTLIGVFMLGFSTSYIFRVFFKMFLMVIVFGLLHGVVLLPVLLSLIGSMTQHSQGGVMSVDYQLRQQIVSRARGQGHNGHPPSGQDKDIDCPNYNCNEAQPDSRRDYHNGNGTRSPCYRRYATRSEADLLRNRENCENTKYGESPQNGTPYSERYQKMMRRSGVQTCDAGNRHLRWSASECGLSAQLSSSRQRYSESRPQYMYQKQNTTKEHPGMYTPSDASALHIPLQTTAAVGAFVNKDYFDSAELSGRRSTLTSSTDDPASHGNRLRELQRVLAQRSHNTYSGDGKMVGDHCIVSGGDAGATEDNSNMLYNSGTNNPNNMPAPTAYLHHQLQNRPHHHHHHHQQQQQQHSFQVVSTVAEVQSAESVGPDSEDCTQWGRCNN